MTLKHDVDTLARRTPWIERGAAERMVSVFTLGGFLVSWYGGPTYMLPAEHAYAAFQAVWTRHHAPEPEPLGYHLFCLALCDRGNDITHRHGTDWFPRNQLNVGKLCAELVAATSPNQHPHPPARSQEGPPHPKLTRAHPAPGSHENEGDPDDLAAHAAPLREGLIRTEPPGADRHPGTGTSPITKRIEGSSI